jgi:serine/threonine-protein kinase HipA
VNKTLDVYLNTDLAGSLSQSSEHEMTFAYSPNATRSISIGMPIGKKSFGASHCEAFFGGLLPEGDAARKALGRRFGTSASNSFGLLRNIGAECAGALSIVAPGQTVAAEGLEEVQLLSPADLAQHIRELPQRPLFVGVNGIRLSLSGVQDKASVSLIDSAIGLPRSGPTTHILKPDLSLAPGAIYCEHLCMKIASRIGIEVAAVNLAKAEDQVYLLVERYDRVRVDVRKQTSEKIERIHQEDFCQALAIPSSRKYQEDGGPKLIDCFTLLNQTAVPAKDRLKLLTAVIFNFLAGNMDAHGKNFSLLHHQKGIRLAPLYDVICTAAFPDYSANMAMDIGDYFEPENINAHEWRTLCVDIQYSFPAFKKLAKRLCAAIPDAGRIEYMQMQAAGWTHPSCDRALEIMQANCKQMQDRLRL